MFNDDPFMIVRREELPEGIRNLSRLELEQRFDIYVIEYECADPPAAPLGEEGRFNSGPSSSKERFADNG